MRIKDAVAEIQKMHETKEVTRKSIIAWYSLYSRKLPMMEPERSDVELIRTIDLWMYLTEQGGRPAFPYGYKAKIYLESIDMISPAKVSKLLPVEAPFLLLGIILLLFADWRLFIIIMLICLAILSVIDYKLRGGAKNPELLRKKYERVFGWMEGQVTRGN